MRGSPDLGVLDANLERLLRQAYVPARPAPAFRERLHADFLSELARRTGVEGARPGRGRLVALRTGGLVAAAALVLALGWIGWRSLAPSAVATTTAEDLVAGGRVALREGAGPWRAARAEELARGVAVAGALEVATPPGTGVDLLGAAGRLRLEEDSALALGAEGEALTGALARGELLAEHGGEGSAWVLRTGPGALVLERGRARAAKSGESERFLLFEGRARYDGPAGTLPLAPGEELVLVAGLPAPALTALADPSPTPRRAVEAPAPEPETLPEAAATPTLLGRVRDAEGAPVARFRVAVLRERRPNEYRDPLVREFDDPEGEFTWEGLPPGRHRVFVVAEEYATAPQGEREVRAGSAPAEVEASLVRGGGVRGHVVDVTTGNPVPDALVVVERDTPQDGLLLSDARQQWLPASTHTASDGGFELPNVSPGAHTLRVTAPGHAPAWSEELRVAESDLVEGVLVQLGPGGALEGRVTREDGAPRSGALVIVSMMEQTAHPQMNFALAITDTDGRFRVEDLPPTLMLAILVDLDDSARPTVRSVEIVPGRTARVDFLGDAAGVRLVGQLTSADGEPLAHRNLGLIQEELGASFSENFLATTTLDDGSYSFDNILPGRYQLYVVEALGRWVRWIDEVDVRGSGEQVHDVTVLDARISGRVVDGRNGEGLPGTVLIVYRHDEATGELLFGGNAQAGADGGFEIDLLNPGRYVVTAYAQGSGLGFESAPELELSELEPTAELQLALLAGGSARVEVVDREGRAVPFALVDFLDEAGHSHTFSQYPTTDEAGRYEARGLRPGRYRVRALAPGFVEGTVELVCRAGEENRVRVVLGPEDEDAERDENARNER